MSGLEFEQINVEVRVQRSDGTWAIAHTQVPDDLLDGVASVGNDRRQERATAKVSSAFTLAYSKAYPREPGRHRHRKGS